VLGTGFATVACCLLRLYDDDDDGSADCSTESLQMLTMMDELMMMHGL